MLVNGGGKHQTFFLGGVKAAYVKSNHYEDKQIRQVSRNIKRNANMCTLRYFKLRSCTVGYEWLITNHVFEKQCSYPLL